MEIFLIAANAAALAFAGGFALGAWAAKWDARRAIRFDAHRAANNLSAEAFQVSSSTGRVLGSDEITALARARHHISRIRMWAEQ